jgi:hypothetical protein
MWNGHIPLRSFDAHFPALERAGEFDELTVSQAIWLHGQMDGVGRSIREPSFTSHKPTFRY